MQPSRLLAALAAVALAGLLVWGVLRRPGDSPETTGPAQHTESSKPANPSTGPLPSEALMQTYADPTTDPIEDLRALDRVLIGYFSIIKEHTKYPIGGNEDLAAALRGENASRQKFLPADHPVFDSKARLVDRWGTPLFVHPVAGRDIELRSAGPDQTMFTDDDLELDPQSSSR